MRVNRRVIPSLVAIAIAAAVFTQTILVSAHAAAVESDPLLLALALCGAGVSIVNGFGRRMTKAYSQNMRSSKVERRMATFPS